ncbi:MAG: hypothetical protein ACE5JS_14210 [Nitrospinota bacterium]
MPGKARVAVPSVVLAGVLAGCAPSIPKEALQLSPESLQDRQLQTRRFDTQDEEKLLAASAALLQDIGFLIDESETRLGVIVASKDRSAVSGKQVAVKVFFALLGANLPIDRHQRMRAAVVTRPVGEEGKGTAVRVTFQRIVWNEQRQITKRERLNDPKIYQEFFSKLSKAVFLEAHEL